MNTNALLHEVTVYYEDTDLTGAVYHANYLKYFERAREHALGVEALVELYRDHGIGFVVYKAALTYREPALHGDLLHIVTSVKVESEYRVSFLQIARRARDGKDLVTGHIELVCVDKDNELVPLPSQVQELVEAG